MLEKIEVPPCTLDRVMDLAAGMLTDGAVEGASSGKVERQVELLPVGIELKAYHRPRGGKTKGCGEQCS